MARPAAESTFRAPLARREVLSETHDDGFERELMGFCVTAILDQRSVYGESRVLWAERLRLSKSHISKMTESPTPAFIELFDLALSQQAAPGSPVVALPASGGERLHPLLSEFYTELRPAYRGSDRSSSVIRWFARYRPRVSRQLADVLYESAVADERCRMLERGGYADQDVQVREAIRKLLLVVSGPYGASVIAHRQCTELGLHVPLAFFDELEETLDSSPLGFRVLRTLVRFVRLWRADGVTNLEHRHVVDAQLVQLLGKLPAATAAGSFVDPYPGSEWAVGLARECLKLDVPADGDGLSRGDLFVEAMQWLFETLEDRRVSDRGRLYAAWVIWCHADAAQRDRVQEYVSSRDASPYLRKWAPLLAVAGDQYAVSSPFAAASAAESPAGSPLLEFGGRVLESFADEVALVDLAVREHTEHDAKYNGIREALVSVLVSALLTPDGRIRRALIEAIVNARLVDPASNILAALLGLDGGENSGEAVLKDPALVETAIFLHGRLRRPKDARRVEWLIEQAVEGSDDQVRHAAVWSIGDIWSWDLPAQTVIVPLERLAVGPDLPVQIRLAAANVLAIIAHQQAHRPDDADPLAVDEDARAALTRVFAAQDDMSMPGSELVRAICFWGTTFDRDGLLETRNLLTLSGILDGVVLEKHDLPFEGDTKRSAHRRTHRAS